MPFEGLQHRNGPSEPRPDGLPDGLRELPRYRGLDGWQVRSLSHRISADQLAHRSSAGLRRLPRQQQLQFDER